MSRVILHSDFNNFYASVECLFDSSLRGKPVAVAGDAEARHGIVLAKNDIAKRYGIKTGEALWQARQKCPSILFVPAHYDRYIHYASLAREIYIGVTDQVESFGLDECWLDVTGSAKLFGSGKEIADNLRYTLKKELGLTVSVGVSYNKVFAKLGSDMKKPDATTVIGENDYREKVWSLPVRDLLYVGPATERKLKSFCIYTIGDLAKASPDLLYRQLGKNGMMLHRFANGLDTSAVASYVSSPPIKSVGNSTTAPHDLVSEDDIKITLLSLCESVASRLRDQRCICSTVQVSVRDNELYTYGRQARLRKPTANTRDIYELALSLVIEPIPTKPVRSLSVRACGLSPDEDVQLSFWADEIEDIRQRDIDHAVDKIRARHGYYAIRRGITLLDPRLDLDAKKDNIIHPIGFLGTQREDID